MSTRPLPACLNALLLALPAFAAAEQARSPAGTPAPLGTLGRYVPGDVWMYACKVHTPSQDFLTPHWQRVFAALKDCGIEQELRYLIRQELEPAQKTAFEQGWADLAETISGIAWSDLIKREAAFAERFGGFVPEFIFLCRPRAETLEANLLGLGKLFALLDSFDKNDDFIYADATVDGVRTWSIESRKAPIGLFMLHKGDVLALIVGRSGMVDVRALLSGADSAAPSILEQPRYRAALADVPQAECGQVFLDFDRLLKALHRMPEVMFGEREAPPEFAATGKRILRTVIGHFDFIDYLISTSRMEGVQEFNRSCVRLKAHCEGNPCHRMVVNRQPFDDFTRYVPVDANGFTANTFIDLGVLYETILETIHAVLPGGPATCERWAELQEEWNFNVQEDVLSWLSGEFITVSLPAVAPSPFGGGEGVLLVRVKDAAKAAAKVRAGLGRAVPFLVEHGQPVSVRDATRVPAEGFQTVNYAMLAAMGVYPCVGAWDQWLVIGSSEAAVGKVIDTAAGRHPNVLQNPRYQREGIRPPGPVSSASFTDLTDCGEQMRSAFIGVGFAGAMIPDQRETRPIKALLNTLGRLVPVFEQIDFFSSTSSVTVFKDGAWYGTSVVTYKPSAASLEQPKAQRP